MALIVILFQSCTWMMSAVKCRKSKKSQSTLYVKKLKWEHFCLLAVGSSDFNNVLENKKETSDYHVLYFNIPCMVAVL